MPLPTKKIKDYSKKLKKMKIIILKFQKANLMKQWLMMEKKN